MKIVICGRFEYMKVAWESMVGKEVYYFDSDYLRNISLLERLAHRGMTALYKCHLISEKRYLKHQMFFQYSEYIDFRSLKRSDDIVFIVYEMNLIATSYELLQSVKEHYPKSKLVLFFTNKIGSVREEVTMALLQKCRKYYDLIYTFNKKDAEQYSFRLFADGAFPYSPATKRDRHQLLYDVFWSGKNKNRYKQLTEVALDFQRKGITYHFIMADDTVDDSFVDENGIEIIKTGFTYEQTLECLLHARCILDIVQEGSGTIKYTEAIAYGKN